MLRASSTASLEEAIKLGKRKFQEGDFEGAEQSFNKALCINRKDLRALEGKVVCLEKKGDLAKALSDARLMIKEAPNNAQGYLRCAKLLRLLNRIDDSFGVYQVGLKLVPRSDRLFHELEKHSNHLLMKTKASDNASCGLPTELFRGIMKCLDDPFSLARTSKAFAITLQELVSSSPELTVNFLKANCLKRLLPGKTRLIVEGSTALKNLLVAIKAGAEFHITECRFIDCDRVDPFDLCRAKSLGFLQNLKLVMLVGTTSEVLWTVIMSQAASLQTLLLEGVDCNGPVNVNLPNLHSLVVHKYPYGQHVVDFIKGNPLKVLHTDTPKPDNIYASDYTNYCFGQQELFDGWVDRRAFPFWTRIDFDLPLRVCLNRIDCQKLSISNGMIHSDSPCSVRELYLSKCQLQHVQWSGFSHLQVLWLEDCLSGLSEPVLDSIVTKLPRLRELVICGTAIRAAYLPLTFVNNLSRLSVLGLIECTGAVIDDVGSDSCVYLKTRAEFEFIKKKRWEIEWKCIRDSQ